MRIHIQNPADPADRFPITVEEFDAARTRADEPPNEADPTYDVSVGDTDAAFAAGIATAEILIAPPGAVVGRFPCRAPMLKLIFCTGAGLDKLIPFDWLPDGVILLNNSGTHGAKALEYVTMALLMLNSRLPAALAAQHAGLWRPNQRPTLRGSRVTVVGTGHIGTAAARGARFFGADVTGVRARPEPHPDFDRIVVTGDLDAVLPETEFLVLACPLVPATRNIMDRRRLQSLPHGAGIVNVGRGGLLDQDALCDLLDAEHLSGAVLDVFTPEPLPPGHRVWTTRNLVATPHDAVDDLARYNPDSLDIFFRNLRAWRSGAAMPNRIDLARGY